MSPAIKKTSKYILKSRSTKAILVGKPESTLASTSSAPQRPSAAYLALVNSPPSKTLDPLEAARRKKHLLILDLNGTLVSRTKKRNSMFVRPHIDTFLDYIFDHFRVMVWSSAQGTSVNHMLYLFGEQHRKKLYTVWNRSHFGLSPQDFNKKSATVKDLTKVWGRYLKYDAHSTVILDDSPSKSVLQPFNTIQLSTFDHGSDDFWTHGDHELLSVMNYLKQIQLQTNIPNFIRNTPFTSSISPLDELDETLQRESKVCYFYGFFDQVKERWDFSEGKAQVDKLNSDSEATDKDESD